KHGDDDIFALAVEGAPDLQVSFEGAEGTSVSVPANETLLQRVYVIAPKGSEPAKSDRTEFDFVVTDQVGGETVTTGTVFNGKAQ
ncbi:MAG TPA: cytochrome c oxidase accessory protein CcoG, partial [Rhodobacteraceae bacterium]|nr:cytochrome c oxidase accessory protein CcoG [Paracoccaceae bacterium]